MSPTSLPNEFYPLLADYDPSDIPAYQLVWATFREMPEFSRKLLTSDELPSALKDFSEKFNLTQSTAAFISVMVRKIIFREWDEEQSRAELTAWCQEFDPKNASRADEILEAVKKDILTIVPSEEGKIGETEKIATVRMTLLEALSQYPQLGQQTITETRIKLKANVELVRGSLINWLKCYREELGVGYHDAMLRGQFLFRSQNGIKLLNEERGRIEILLRSIEDRETVEIDTVHQVLVFPPYTSPKNPLPEQAESVAKEPPFTTPVVPTISVVPLKAPVVVDVPPTPVSETSKQEVLSLTSNGTGAMHVLNRAQSSPSQQTIGTLHFSSKHILPVEKEIQSGVKEQGNNPDMVASGSPNVENFPVPPQPAEEKSSLPPVSLPDRKDVAKPGVDDIPRPAPAPKREVNLNYIPNPFRIDPMKREMPEKE